MDVIVLSKQRSNQSLKSIVIPWTIIATIAVVASIFLITSSDDSQQLQQMDHDYDTMSTYGSIKRFIREVQEQNGYKQEHYAYEHHKSLMPLDARDYRGFFFAVIGLMIAAGGGIGGGGILVPIYILVMGFTPKHAIPLSNVTVFGGALANTVLNVKKRHPLADRPLVDWDLILIMEPLTIAGALIGAFLNKLLKEEVLAVMLVLLLSSTAYNTLKKALKMYNIESAQLKEQKVSSVKGESELTKIPTEDEDEEEDNRSADSEDALLDDIEVHEDYEEMNEAELNQNTVLKKILEEEKVIPTGNLTLLVIMFVVVLFINLMKGGGAFPSPLGIKCGSTSFWTANFVMIAWIVMISLMARSYLLHRYNLKETCGYQ